MKILICSKLFYPSDRIGAVRPSNFAKYLAEFGHDVTVLTEDTSTEDIIIKGVEIIRFSNSTLIKKLINKNTERVTTQKQGNSLKRNANNKVPSNNLRSKLKELFFKNRRHIFSLLIDLDWFLKANRYIKRNYNKKEFDVVISSYGPLSSFLLGKSIKKSRVASYWLCDFRDNMRSNIYPKWLNYRFIKYEKTAVRYADAITFVSIGQKDMFIRNNNISHMQEQKIHTIYNGYENAIDINDRDMDNDGPLKLAYTGQLYSGVRDFTMLFHVINNLIEEEIIDKEFITIEYAGPSSKELIEQLEGFEHVKQCCTDYGFVTREKALEIQRKCDILVALTWNTNEEQGILTGKFLEYLQSLKPIISITSGVLPDGELTKMTREMNLGIACEYITYKKDYINLRKYISNQFKLKMNNGGIEFSPKYKCIKSFHYHEIVSNFNDILLESLNSL